MQGVAAKNDSSYDLSSVSSYSPGGPIALASPDDAWADEFSREAAATTSALADLSTAVHHIGSAAIDGLVANPVLDILLVVRQLDASDCAGFAGASI